MSCTGMPLCSAQMIDGSGLSTEVLNHEKHPNAFDRTTGSHPLAAADQRERYYYITSQLSSRNTFQQSPDAAIKEFPSCCMPVVFPRKYALNKSI